MTQRAEILFQEHREQIYRRTDRMFALLMFVQWLAGIAAAVWISPHTWAGAQSSIHLHVWMAVLLGGAIVSLPIALAHFLPGRPVTRHVIAVAQMLYASLLIHLTGGRIETHFHIFGSLAFLGFYRDWRVLLSASLVVAADHFFRGLFWPESVYGVSSTENWRWLEHTGWVVFEDVFIILATFQSITEMREIAKRRAQLEQNENHLGEAIQLRDSFLSVCSHELKTPLTSMKLQGQLGKRLLARIEQGQASVENLNDLFTRSDRQLDRLTRLVEDMLDVSRIQNGKLDFKYISLDLAQLTREVVETFSLQLEAAGCEISIDAPESLTGYWDRLRIEQVLINLVSNAAKYAAGKPIRISVAAQGSQVRISVRDCGMGISREKQSMIFDRFARAISETNISGLGLGLFITRSIIEEHGGTISVESEPGQGAEFVVLLPLDSRLSRRGKALEPRSAPV